jgi:hypothetical protein
VLSLQSPQFQIAERPQRRHASEMSEIALPRIPKQIATQPASLFINSDAQSRTHDVSQFLQKRLGRLHAKLRLGIEADHEAQIFGQGINYFHIENLKLSHLVIRACLKLTGLYRRGRRNAAHIEVRHNYIISPQISKAFDGYTILQLSDLHVDMSQDAMTRLTAILKEMNYDLCVLTGDYRGQTFGSYEATLAGMSQICAAPLLPAQC